MPHATSEDGSPPAAGPRHEGEATPLHVAIVHLPGIICHVAADVSLSGLHEKLGEYVREHCRYQLSADDAERVRSLLSQGRPGEAVEHYFSRVGSKWDLEKLTRVKLNVGIPAGGQAS